MIYSLNGKWLAKPDPGKKGEREKWFDTLPADTSTCDWEETDVPGCWNNSSDYFRYEGTFWYMKDFRAPTKQRECDVIKVIRFFAVNYLCKAWLNGVPLGTHEGGWLPFEYIIPEDVLALENRLVVMVDNERSPKRIPGELCDWFNYGGIVRDVQLHYRSPRHFRDVKVKTDLECGEAVITVSIFQHEVFDFAWEIEFEGAAVAGGVFSPRAVTDGFEIRIKNPSLWTPDAPNLYFLKLSPAPEAEATGYEVRFGIRTIRVSGHWILLNGEKIKLKGVSLHEELLPYGRSIPRAERFRDVRDIKSLGFNALRTAHYTHDEALVDAADEIGLLVLEEIPVYWSIDYADGAVYDRAAAMVRDMIDRDYNHPSVILWSVGNEVPVENPDCACFMRRLMEETRRQDDTRIVTYVSSRFALDETRRASDVACLNCYVGWYFGDERMLPEILDITRTTAPDKPWIITEFGAGAKAGFLSPFRKRFSENRQARLLEYYIKTLNSLDWMAGWFIWIYRDFRSPLRMNKHQHGFNRKGLVSEKREQKKICARFPALLVETVDVRKAVAPKLKAKILRFIEEVAMEYALDMIMSSQRKKYDDFYSDKPGE